MLEGNLELESERVRGAGDRVARHLHLCLGRHRRTFLAGHPRTCARLSGEAKGPSSRSIEGSLVVPRSRHRPSPSTGSGTLRGYLDGVFLAEVLAVVGPSL